MRNMHKTAERRIYAAGSLGGVAKHYWKLLADGGAINTIYGDSEFRAGLLQHPCQWWGVSASLKSSCGSSDFVLCCSEWKGRCLYSVKKLQASLRFPQYAW